MRTAACILALGLLALSVQAADPYWAAPMQQVHANFTGTAGTISQLGDSITISQAFFSPLQYSHANASVQAESALSWLQGYIQPQCWGWKGWQYGNNGGTISDFALDYDFSATKMNIDYWLETMNPEIAVIMWGTNDAAFELEGPGLPDFTGNMTTVVQKCKANGTIPILTTIPPMHFAPQQWGYNYVDVTAWVNAIRNVAQAEQVPLIEYYEAIIARRPNYGSDPTDGEWNGTLLVLNDRHPSNTSPTRDFGETMLSTNGYTLRNHETLLKMYEVYNEAIVPEPAALSLLAAGCLALLRPSRVPACPRRSSRPQADPR